MLGLGLRRLASAALSRSGGDRRARAYPVAEPTQHGAALAELREQVDKSDAIAEPGAPPPLNRLVAEFGLRSFETLRDRALWALDHRGENTA